MTGSSWMVSKARWWKGVLCYCFGGEDLCEKKAREDDWVFVEDRSSAEWIRKDRLARTVR